jgi:hypothetical protein
LAVLVLGRACSGPTIEALDVQRFAAIYEHIKLSQPAVIGPEHFPVVAVLAARGEAPETIASGVEASYRALIDEAELSGAPALHCAASLLHATNYEPSEAARRFEMLRAQLHKRGYGVAQSAYEQIATLCFLTQPIDDVVDGVSQGCERLRREFAWLSKEAAFTLAVGLVCVAALGQKSNFASVVDAEALLDLQPIVAL